MEAYVKIFKSKAVSSKVQRKTETFTVILGVVFGPTRAGF